MARHYKPNNASFGRFMLSPGVQDAAKREAEKMVAYLRATVKRVSGDYARAFKVEVGYDVNPGPHSGPRAAAFIVNTEKYAAALETGTARIQNPPKPLTTFAASASARRRIVRVR